MDSGFLQIPHWLPSGSNHAILLVRKVQGEFLRAPLPSPTCSLLPRAMAGLPPASRLACRSHATGPSVSSDPPPRVHRHRYTRTGDRIRPTHSVVTAVPVVGLNRPPDPVLRVCLPEHPESPFSNACMRRHASSPAPTWLPSPCSRPSSVLSSPPYLPWCDWISYPSREKGQRTEGQRALARRNPTLRNESSGLFLKRKADRTYSGVMFQPPPRTTRRAQSPLSRADPSSGASS